MNPLRPSTITVWVPATGPGATSGACPSTKSSRSCPHSISPVAASNRLSTSPVLPLGPGAVHTSEESAYAQDPLFSSLFQARQPAGRRAGVSA